MVAAMQVGKLALTFCLGALVPKPASAPFRAAGATGLWKLG